MQHFLLVLGANESGERHLVHLAHIIFLVRLLFCTSVLFTFQSSPFVIKQNKQIRNALQISRVTFHHDATRKKFLELLDELRLKLTFEHWQMSLLSCDFSKLKRECLFLKNSFFTPLFIKGDVIFARRKSIKKKTETPFKHLGQI
nr:MAG TPA: hypothetical protein [Caudoviricetes sp.]